MTSIRALAPFLAITGLAILTVWAYWPGLHGAFLFDDFINLPSLGAEGPITHWQIFWRYVTSGHADPTGRPIAMASFLIDAQNWPAEPFAFKRTNLILHLINGGLLFQLLNRLGKLYLGPESQHGPRQFAAVVGAGTWLLHPFLVSTTLYVVQREAMLPVTFTLAGLMLWLHGRQAMLQEQSRKGCSWLFAGLGICTALAVLSKANGILLPALALCIEFTAPAPQGRTAQISAMGWPRDGYRVAMWFFAGLPTLLIAGYLAYIGWQGITQDLSATRPWTLGQRLLTEPRVLAEYLKLLWLPRPFTTGLFNDQVLASTSLLSPPSTLWAMLLVLALISAAVLARRSHPLFSLAILFYFTAQSMESSTIALELYFEHRNYLPSLLLFWPLAAWLCHARPLTSTRRPVLRISMRSVEWQWIKPALALVLILGLSLMTHARASLWGNSQDQALLWAKLNADSPRAQANAAMAEIGAGHPERAIMRLRPLLHEDHAQVQLALNLLSATCAMGHLDAQTLEDSAQALRLTRDTGTLLTSWFERAIGQAENPQCPELTTTALAKLLSAARTNPNFTRLPGRRQDLDYLEGKLALTEGKPDMALASFNRALDQQVRPGIALQQAALLGAAGYPSQALAHLDHYEAVKDREERPGFGMPRIHSWVLERQQYWPKELSRLRHTLRDDLKAQAKPSQ